MIQTHWTLPEQEYIHQGHLACPGCGERIALRLALKTLGPKTILVVPAACSTVCDGPFPHSAAKVPLWHAPFASAAVTAAGIRASLDMQGQRDVTVLAWAGDGGTFDIGLQSLSGTAERNDRIVYVCYDNEAYMNTGVQRSSATPQYMATMTTPGEGRKTQPKKDLVGIVAAHGVPYAATAVVGYPEDFVAKLRRARDTGGFALVHLLSPCPTGWRTTPDATIRLSRLAARCRLFPLYEVECGDRYHVQEAPPAPLEEYLRPQGRYAHLSADEVVAVRQWIDARWSMLLKRASTVSKLSMHPGEEAQGMARPSADEVAAW